MFYEGDLQSGIAIALQQNKSVVCFICDDGEESKAWEKDVFGDEEVTSTARSSAIVFRLMAGSQEAEYLKAFCPVTNPPTVVVIRNGQVKDTFVAGTAQDEIRQRLIAGLSESIVSERPQPTTIESPTSAAEVPPPAQAAAAPASASPIQSSTPHAVEEAKPKPADKPQKSARQEQLERQRKEKQKEREYKAQVLARI
ncbi:bifunctional farnesyl-diphosphate farnesyltransferase/squalene synthase, partial [Ascosphaera pollenicola]